MSEKDYFVLAGNDAAQLMERVNGMLKQGYRLCGSLQVITQNHAVRLYQAVIKHTEVSDE